MDIKKQPKPWHIRYRYHILAGATGLTLLVYTLSVVIASGTKRVDKDRVVTAEVTKAPFLEYVMWKDWFSPSRSSR